MRKKKLLFIIWSFSYGGGAEKILSNLLSGLDYDKYEVDLIEYKHFDIKREYIPCQVTLLSPILDMTKDNKEKEWLIDRLSSYVPYLVRKKYIRKKYDIEIAFNYSRPTFLLTNSFKTVSWVHGSVLDLLDSDRLYNLHKKKFKKIGRIVAISENTKNSIEKLFPDQLKKIKLINNGFNFTKIRELSNQSCEKIKENSICYIGRLEHGKHPEALLELMDIMKNEYKLIPNLYYLGFGDLRNSLEKVVKEKKLGEFVHFLGYVDNPYVYMKQCKCIVMMSGSEGFPTVFAEGMALGVPFISSNVGGMKELSNHGKCGYVIESVNECAMVLNRLLQSNQDYAKSCQEHIEGFTIEHQVKLFDELIDDILRGE